MGYYDDEENNRRYFHPGDLDKYADPEYLRQAEEYEREQRYGGENAGYDDDYGMEDSAGQAWEEEPMPRRPKGYNSTEKSHETGRADRVSRAGGSRRRGRRRRSAPADSYASGGRGAAAARRHHPGRWIRRIIAILLILILAFLVYFYLAVSKLETQDTTGKNFAISSQAANDLADYRNIAILGSDARKGESYDGSRTDAIIVMSINKKNNQVRMISVMRDSYLMMRGPSGDLMCDKLTHAHAYGGGINTISTLNRNLDLNITEYVIFNWKAVKDAVDTLGGVEIDVKKNEIQDLNHYGHETARNTGGHYRKIRHSGPQNLSGVQAVTYCRIRKTSGGDVARGKRYRQVVQAVVKKAVLHPILADKMLDTVLPQVRTNMTKGGILTAGLRSPLMKFGSSISWPKNYYGGILGGVWYAVPTTLNSGVSWLHEKAFDQAGYDPSSRVQDISSQIVVRTGLQ